MRTYKLTDTNIKQVMRIIKTQLSSSTDLEETLKLTVDLKALHKDKPKAQLLFSDTAKDKIKALVKQCGDEIAWHGTVIREDNIFRVDNILCYPQRVTGATCKAIDGDYDNWLIALDDNTHASLRLQGHSHCNMGVFASATDKNYMEEIVSRLQNTQYQIFIICNKKDEIWATIYDIQNNIIYEKEDIITNYNTENTQMSWAEEEIKKYLQQVSTNYFSTNSITDFRQQRFPIDTDYEEALISNSGLSEEALISNSGLSEEALISNSGLSEEVLEQRYQTYLESRKAALKKETDAAKAKAKGNKKKGKNNGHK